MYSATQCGSECLYSFMYITECHNRKLQKGVSVDRYVDKSVEENAVSCLSLKKSR